MPAYVFNRSENRSISSMPELSPTDKALPKLAYKANWYPPWGPRFWNGMRVGDFLKLLQENRFRIHPTRYPMTALVSFCSLLNSCAAPIQSAFLGKKVANTDLVGPPVFIIGHWRSGTTLLHELMSLDENFASPNNFDTFVPHHFLLTGWFAEPMVDLLMPSTRPMDNMRLKTGLPQEDEFALLSMGGPTAYRRVAFPNEDHQTHRFLDGQALNDEERTTTRIQMEDFFKALTYKYKKRLVLKSPPHTGRIQLLREWFPGCKFIHISRHPHKVVPSTLRLWQTIDQVQSFQIAKYDTASLLDYVTICKNEMYSAYNRDQKLLEENEIAQVKFEDLVEDPVREVARVYRQLEIDDPNPVAKKIEQDFRSRKHKTNSLDLDEALRERIDNDWQDYMDQFDY